jgi:uncharacterized PurR-regulated membrane protein YhhQ (DUF165 family)|tara:strand:- start:731 stop:871 length:141 start_codon:yes stop_codon:yes gene_type:complete
MAQEYDKWVVYLDKDLKHKTKLKALMFRTTVSAWVSNLIRQELKKK